MFCCEARVRKKTQRLYGEEGLAVRRCRSRRRIAVARTPIPRPDGPNSRWSTDFVHDQLANGRRFRVLTILDDVTRECLAAVPDTSLSGKRVVREMNADRPARPTRRDRQRQWHRVHLLGGSGLQPGGQARLALHRAGQAHPERLRRELPRADAGRMPQRASLLLDQPRPRHRRRLGRGLQYSAAPFGDRLHDAAAYAATLKPQRASVLRHLESSAPMPVATVALTRNSQHLI